MKKLLILLISLVVILISLPVESKGFSSSRSSFSSSRSVSITKSSPPKTTNLTKTQPVLTKPKTSYTKPVIIGATGGGLVGGASIAHSSVNSKNTTLSTTTNKVSFLVKDIAECFNIRDKQIIISGKVRIFCKINGTEIYIR